MDERKFPILSSSKEKEYIPWSVIEPHEKRAIRNHSQSLEELSQRGGLSWSEALAILTNAQWRPVIELVAKNRVLELIVESKRNLCVRCGEKIKWGAFAYNQDTCWDCFIKEIHDILERSDLTESDKEIIKHMAACMAEIHHKERPKFSD